MKRALVLMPALLLLLLPAALGSAAGAAGAKPSIIVVSPQNGAVVKGSTVTMQVAVSDFTLVKPVLKNPPPPNGNVGHIQYALDSTANVDVARDASMSLTHTWTNVTPGRHTLIAYLANTLSLPFPTAKPAQISITVQPGSTQPPPSPQPNVSNAPTTGGGLGNSGLRFNLNLFLLGVLLFILGLGFIGRRYAFAAVGSLPRQSPDPGVAIAPPQAFAFESGGGSEDSSTPQGLQSTEGMSDHSPVPPQETITPEPESEPKFGARDPQDTPAQPYQTVTEPPYVPIEHAYAANEPQPVVSPLQTWNLPASSVSPEPSGVSEEAVVPSAPSSWQAPTQGPPIGDASDDERNRSRALEMAQQWSGVVQDLVSQLDKQEAERRQMQDRISALERMVHEHEALRQAFAESAADDPISGDDVQTAQFVADSLVKDPDHIVVLASVAQNAQRIARIVNRYARIHRAIGDG
jgi:hypothetical protein